VIALLKKLTLRTRIFLFLTGIVLITLIGGAVMIWYTYRMEAILSRTAEMNISSGQTIEPLLEALIKQKGYVAYYFLDENPKWLEKLALHRQEFLDRLKEAQAQAVAPQDREILQEIGRVFAKYVEEKEQVIQLYRAGERQKGLERYEQVWTSFSEVVGLCEAYKKGYDQRIQSEHERSRRQARKIRGIAAGVVSAVIVLSILLSIVLLTQVLDPIRRLASVAGRFGGPKSTADEIKALSRGVKGLIEDSDQAHSELERNRLRLFQAERMAVVGKLAAGVAHSIRNPMTSIKMRLFSLERSLPSAPAQREDFEVISEEIRHIDTIVQNFLEYSRPSKLKMQKVSPSDVVDLSLSLARHRLKSYGIDVELKRSGALPEVRADPDQLKEVFVNLLVNACEAMTHGGAILIEEEAASQVPLGPVAVIRIRDTGPGIPPAIQEKVFEPFFSTKEEGTGLGLSIAVRIVHQHGGQMRLDSKEGEGATFTITLPCREDKSPA